MLSGGISTPFSYTGYTTDQWLLTYDLQPASMMPNAEAVAEIQQNPDELQVRDVDVHLLLAIDMFCCVLVRLPHKMLGTA